MGQVYLGFRSLLVKLAIFVVMAALLAWAIGGTLWPRTAVGIVGSAIIIDGHRIALVDRLRSDGSRSSFALALLDGNREVVEFWPPDESERATWSDALSPVANPDATRGAAAFSSEGRWTVVEFGIPTGGGHPLEGSNPEMRAVADRLEAAQALHRFTRAEAQSAGEGVATETAGSSAG